ncbi:MAG: hypothetical protein WCL07_03515 [bacterium]
MRKFLKKNWKNLAVVLGLLVTIPLTLPLAINAWKYLTGASYKPAALVVQTDRTGDQLNRIWEGVSQGHEQKDLRLDTAVGLMKGVGIKYVRIDHILNGFDVVSKNSDGKLKYDFAKLDLLVSDILAMGAIPYFSVSYMPAAISTGDVTELPKDWGEYGQVVASYVGHYSRDYRGGLSNVVYEIWNEPDLFGGFKTYGDKNYITLYRTAAQAATGVKNTKPFLIGGPATTGFYPAWANDFYTKLTDVRKDFFSWHRYSHNVEDFVIDATLATKTIAPILTTPQKLFISEWGIAADRGNVYDTKLAAAHFLAVSRALVDTNVDLALAFEIQDGANSGEAQFHGGWGMLTNPKFGPVVKKPRFHALEFIQKIRGNRVPIAGEGSYITALAAKDDGGVLRVLAINYDPKGSHEEIFPVTFAGLVTGTYTVTEEYFSGRRLTVDIAIPGGMLKRDIVLPPSESVIVSVVAKP